MFTSIEPASAPTSRMRYGLHRLVRAERGEDITLLIAHEKRVRKWRRGWKHELIERGDPEWRDLFELPA